MGLSSGLSSLSPILSPISAHRSRSVPLVASVFHSAALAFHHLTHAPPPPPPPASPPIAATALASIRLARIATTLRRCCGLGVPFGAGGWRHAVLSATSSARRPKLAASASTVLPSTVTVPVAAACAARSRRVATSSPTPAAAGAYAACTRAQWCSSATSLRRTASVSA